MVHLTSLIVGISFFIILVLAVKMEFPLARPQIGTLMVCVCCPGGAGGGRGGRQDVFSNVYLRWCTYLSYCCSQTPCGLANSGLGCCRVA